MKFIASEEVIRRAMRLACEASKPMGLGFLSWDNNTVFSEELFHISDIGAFVDYADGRMVKFKCYKEKDAMNTWRVIEPSDPEYESWISKYPSYRKLLETAGPIEVLE